MTQGEFFKFNYICTLVGMSHPITLEVNILINTIITQSYLYNVYCITQRLLCINKNYFLPTFFPRLFLFALFSLCLEYKTNTHQNNNEYPLEVILYYNHNHAILAADAMRFQPVSEETKNMFIKLFDEDLSPSSAYRRVLDFLETDAESFAKLYNVPDYK